MSGEDRLALDLEVLLVALRAYLLRLRELWSGAVPDLEVAADVERLVAATGARAHPTEAEAGLVRDLLRRGAEDSMSPLAAIASTLDLDAGEELAVAATWWAEADPQFAVVLGCGHDDGARRHASMSLVRLAVEPFGLPASPTLDDGSPLVRNGVLEPGAGSAEPLRLTPTARGLLAGRQPRSLGLPTEAPERFERMRDALALRLESGPGGVVLLRGPEGVGRRAVAAAAAAACGRAVVGTEHSAAELRLLARLGTAVPVVPATFLDDLEWRTADGPLVAWGGLGDRVHGAFVVDLDAPDHNERTYRWRRGLRRAGLTRARAARLAPLIAARFAFTEGDIDATIERAVLDAGWSGTELDQGTVWEAARKQPEHALEQLASLITPTFTLDDLVLTRDADTKLRELVAHVALKHVVFDELGFRRRLPRGQGVVALFAGPSGTGKTMAAEAIAHALRQDLYRVDLSAVVSKYIGETEKNLATAFDEAERGSAVLFFDEADSLYSKRTKDVRDAHDRYANLEVNYLLQRVETFTGLVILATNRAASLDDAFLRRLRFSITFEAPDERLRRELWRRAFPPEAAVEDLDWDALAAPELTGGNIQSAALAAAFLAASNGGEIRSSHVEHALRREYEKLGRAWPGLGKEAAA